MSFIKNLVILPFATGMAISLSLLTLAAEKPVINNNIECEICNMAENRSKDLF